MHEDFSKKDTADTIKYYQFNYTIQNVLVSLEVLYCFVCMFVFLLIFYWIQKDREDIVTGRTADGVRFDFN